MTTTEQENNQEQQAGRPIDKINMALSVWGSEKFELGTEDAPSKYVITDLDPPASKEERDLLSNDPTLGFEVVLTATLPTKTIDYKGERVEAPVYNGDIIVPGVEALFVDRSQPQHSTREIDGQPREVRNYKGMRAGETITPRVVKHRLGRDVSFSVQIDGDGKLEVTSINDSKPVSVFGFGDARRVSGRAPVNAEVEDSSSTYSADDDQPLSEAAEAAMGLMGADIARIDKGTEEMMQEAEREHPRRSPEEFEEIGRPPVGEVVVEPVQQISLREELAGDIDSAAADAATVEQEQTDSERIDTARFTLADAINHLETDGQSVKQGDRTVLEAIRMSVSTLDSALRNGYDHYNVPAIRTLLQRTVQGLHQSMGAAGRYTDLSANDALKAIDSSLKAIESTEGLEGVDTEGMKSDADGLTSVVADIQNASELVGGLSGRQLGQYVEQLEQMIHQSYNLPIDIDELQRVVVAIGGLAREGGDIDQAILKAGNGAEAAAQMIRDAYKRLPEV